MPPQTPRQQQQDRLPPNTARSPTLEDVMPFFKGALNSIFRTMTSQADLKIWRNTVLEQYALYIKMQEENNIGNFDMERLVFEIHEATRQFNELAEKLKITKTKKRQERIKEAKTKAAAKLKKLLQYLLDTYKASTNPDKLTRKSFWILVATAIMQDERFEVGATKALALYRKAIELYSTAAASAALAAANDENASAAANDENCCRNLFTGGDHGLP